MAAGDTQGQGVDSSPLNFVQRIWLSLHAPPWQKLCSLFPAPRPRVTHMVPQSMIYPQGLLGRCSGATVSYAWSSLLRACSKSCVRRTGTVTYLCTPASWQLPCFIFRRVILAFIISSKLLCCCQLRGLLFSSVHMPDTSEMPPICDVLTTELFLFAFLSHWGFAAKLLRVLPLV